VEHAVIRYMSIAEREARRREQERSYEADDERARAKFERLFGPIDDDDDEPSPPKPHVTRIEASGSLRAFRCSCHAFGTWTTAAKAQAQAEAHVAKPWVRP